MRAMHTFFDANGPERKPESPRPKKPRIATLVRLNDEIGAVIKAAAAKNFRSCAQEIQFRLKRDIDANPESPESPESPDREP